MTGLGKSEKPAGIYQASRIDLSGLAGTVHFVGIGGIGMSALARLLVDRGVAVSGSDREANETVSDLCARGVRVYVGHRPENIEGAGLIVVSTAISEDNPELKSARQRSLPVWHRSQMLAYLSEDRKLLAVSGTHGKTTTTGMIAQVFLDCGLDPPVVVGGIFGRISANSRAGQGEYFVAEADESDGTHASLRSYISVVTNIEADHLENYPGGIEQIRDNMAQFANNSSQATVVCQDDFGCRLIRPRLNGKVITYGCRSTSPDAEFTYESLPGFAMRVRRSGVVLGELDLAVPGEHNKLNALAAVACAMEAGLSFQPVARSLAGFGGVDRRFQIIGEAGGAIIVDDYAHHPTEVAALLKAARQYQDLTRQGGSPPVERVVAVFQPHQPGRLRDLWEPFAGAFRDCDLLILADIYVARGNPIEGITSERFAQAVNHPNVHYIPGKNLAERIAALVRPGDLVLTIGAGDITKVAPELLGLLGQGQADGRDS